MNVVVLRTGTPVCHRWNLCFVFTVCCCRWSSWGLCAGMQWMTVTFQKTAQATPVRWAQASPTGALRLIFLLMQYITASLRFSLFCAVSTKCAQDGWVHMWKGPGEMFDKWLFTSAHVMFCDTICLMSLYRGAALMEGAKPKTDSVNTFGERVSASKICADISIHASSWAEHLW